MFNPIELIREIQQMNEILIEKLDEVIDRLDLLIAIQIEHKNSHAGDGR